MRAKKIINYVKSIAREYSRIDSIVEGLELQKDIPNNVDVNSFIRIKNRVNKSVELCALNNIKIDEKIEDYKKWQTLIKNELEKIKKLMLIFIR